MARTVNTQIVATNKPVGHFQFELRTIQRTVHGTEQTTFHSQYYGIESAEKAQKALHKKLKLK